jgi:hypothetical protein
MGAGRAHDIGNLGSYRFLHSLSRTGYSVASITEADHRAIASGMNYSASLDACNAC